MDCGHLRHQRHILRGPMKMKHVSTMTFAVLCVWSCLFGCVSPVPSKMLESLMHFIKETTQTNKVPPNFDTGFPTSVECQIYVDSFDSISESSMDFTSSLMLSLSWMEPKLYYNNSKFIKEYDVDFLEIDYENMRHVWVPELYFPNEKKARFHKVMNPNQMIRVYPDGRLDYFARLSLTLSCPMNLRNYPFDKQECSLKIESFAYDNSKLILQWPSHLPVDVSRELELPQFQVVKFESKHCNPKEQSRSAGNYSCLEAIFHLERHLQYYLIQMYIPSTLIVIVSWISFWLTVNSVPGRTSLGVLTVLTMTTQSSSVNASLPKVSYIKAIDLWMSTCLIFVFAALIEFAVVNFLSRRDQHRHLFNPKKRLTEPVPVPPTPTSKPSLPTTPEAKENGPGAGLGVTSLELAPSMETIDGASSQELDIEQGTLLKQTVVDQEGRTTLAGQVMTSDKDEPIPCCAIMSAAITLDMVSRAVFPLLFAFFAASYWTYYAYFTPSSLADFIGSMESDAADDNNTIVIQDEK